MIDQNKHRDPLIDHVEGPVGFLLLNRPAKKNALSFAMWQALPTMIDALAATPEVRVLCLTSSSPGIFAAGADIADLEERSGDPAAVEEIRAAMSRAQQALLRCEKPTVAAIDGPCMGGGCGLALHADLRLASERARFAITPAKLGLVYPLEDTKRLIELVGAGTATRMLLTADSIAGQAARMSGLIDILVPDKDFIAARNGLLTSLCEKSGTSQRQLKLMIRRILDGQSAEDDSSIAAFVSGFDSRDAREGFAAFRDRRPPNFNTAAGPAANTSNASDTPEE